MKEKYKAIYDQIYNEFIKIPAGEVVPSVRDLMKRFKVSQVVIAKVLNKLKDANVIETHAGAKSTRAFEGGKKAEELVHVCFAMSDYPSTFAANIRKTFENCFNVPGYKFEVVLFRNHNLSIKNLRINPSCDFLILNTDLDLKPEFISTLAEIDAKIIFVDTILPSIQFDSVCTDNELGGALVAHYFASQNRVGDYVMLLSQPLSHNANARYRGFVREMKLREMSHFVMNCETQAGENATVNAYNKFKNHLMDNSSCRIAGVFCDSDLGALGVLKACNELDIKIPDDLEVIGFDNIIEGEFFHPSLTSIDQKIEHWAIEVSKIIEDYRNGKQRNSFQTYIEPEIIFRESTLKR